MQEPVFVWPSHSPVTLLIALFVLLSLLLLAHLVVRIRGARARRRLIKLEMLDMLELAGNRGLSVDERRLLEDLVRRRSPMDPLRVVTVRRWFNRCISAEMNSLARRASREEFAGTGVKLRIIRNRLGLDYVSTGQPLESTRDLQNGQQIWLSPATEADWVSTKLVLIDEAYLQLQPLNSDLPSSLQSGVKVRCRLGRMDDARYVFESAVADVRQDPKAVLLMHRTGLKRIQTRAHFRIRFKQLVTVGVVDVNAATDSGDTSEALAGTSFPGSITSLSEGGVAVVAQQELPLNIGMQFKLSLPDHEPWDVIAKVVSTSSLSGGRSIIRAGFVGVSDEIREAIGNYAMQQQREAARKESVESAGRKHQ